MNYARVLLIILLSSGITNAQNVGIGTSAPSEKLQVAGNVRTDNASILWPGIFPASASPTINVQYSTVRITAAAGVQANAVSYTAAAAEGQELYIANEDGDPATFVGVSIPPNEARTFIYTNGVWRPASGSGGGSSGWLLTGNAGTVDGVNFLGTTDNVPLTFRVNNQRAGRIESTSAGNTLLGYQCGNAMTVGGNNAAMGYQTMISNTSGGFNTALGIQALYSNTTASQNTAIGVGALFANVAGGNATAVGASAMYYANNTAIPFTNNNVAVGFEALRGSAAPGSNTGNNNTAVGNAALRNNSSGGNNVAIGNLALNGNTTGGGNVAIGHLAGNVNSTGNFNVAIGRQAGQNNTQGGNVFIGDLAGQGNTSGSYNVCIGMWSGNALNGGSASANTFVGYMIGFANTIAGGNTFIGNNAGINTNTGSQNTYLGCQAGQNYTSAANNTYVGWRAGFYTVGPATGGNNVFVGYQAGDNNSTGTGNVVIGYDADVTGAAFTNAIAIGNMATVNASNKIRLGNTTVTAADMQVNWTITSDKNEKSDIRSDVPGLALVSRLQPVTYYYNSHLEAHGKENAIRYTGLLAQDVDAALAEIGIVSSIVAKPAADGTGSWGIRYSEIVMPLIQSVQEQQAMIEALESKVAAQIAEMARMRADIETMKGLLMKGGELE